MSRNLLGAVALAVIGAGMLLPGIWLFAAGIARMAASETATGVVVEILHRPSVRSGAGELAYPVVRFRAAGGLEVTVTSRRGYGGAVPFKEGDTVTVRHAPGNPQDAVIATFFEEWGPASVLTLFGIVFCLGGYAAFRRYGWW